MADYSNSEYWVKVVDNMLNDPAYNKPKYKIRNTQLRILRQQLVEKMAGLYSPGYLLTGVDEPTLCKFIDFVSSFL